MAWDGVASELERHIEELGFDLVHVERGGDARRPVLRLRIDRPDDSDGGVTIDDCARVSRALGELLPGHVLEVSSPGVERPLVRSRDFTRFAGREVAFSGKAPLAGRSRRIEGELLGIEGEGDDQRVLVRLADGDEIAIPRSEIDRAHLIFRWGAEKRQS